MNRRKLGCAQQSMNPSPDGNRRIQRSRLLIVSFAAAGAFWAHAGSAAPVPKDVSWCGTTRHGVMISDALHRQQERRLEREREARGAKAAEAGPARASRLGDVAVVTDDSGLLTPPRTFDLAGRGLRFTTGPRNLRVNSGGDGLDPELGDKLTLRDDASQRVEFANGFRFPFFGKVQDGVFVNSDGSLTFEQIEEQSDRDLTTFLDGPARIAPLFTDLDPSSAPADGGVYVRTAPDRAVVTWLSVPAFG